MSQERIRLKKYVLIVRIRVRNTLQVIRFDRHLRAVRSVLEIKFEYANEPKTVEVGDLLS